MVVYVREPKSTVEELVKGGYARVPSPESSLRSRLTLCQLRRRQENIGPKSSNFQLKIEVQVRNMLLRVGRVSGLENGYLEQKPCVTRGIVPEVDVTEAMFFQVVRQSLFQI